MQFFEKKQEIRYKKIGLREKGNRVYAINYFIYQLIPRCTFCNFANTGKTLNN
jgi:hypothetical protein